ncbi:MAG: terminase TerL endonuclease subunit [Pseudomonadota bacterium]
MAKLKRSTRNIRWIEEHCRIPEGKLVGQPVKLRKWQRKELEKIYDNPAGTRQAIISFPRKNGKTALISFLLLLHLCGPEAQPNSQLYSAAQSKDQAATIYKLAAKTVRLSPTLNQYVIPRDTVKELACPELGTLYAALSAEKSTAHGKSPIFAVHDELGQVKGPVSELYEAVETGMGAHEAPLSVIISTQAPTDNDLLSRLIDEALTGADPKTTVSVYSAPEDADPFCEETLKNCNPAWGDFLNAEEVLRTMRKAEALPSQEPGYRNLHLNQRVDQSTPAIARSVWEACGGAVSDWGDAPVYAGLDLSATADLTAFVPIAWIEDAWETKPTFWLPEEGLKEKSRADRVPYDVWAADRDLETTPGRSIEYEWVAKELWQFCQAHNVAKIAFDRWGFKYLRPWLLKAGFTEEQIEELFVEFGQGFASISPAFRSLESALLNEKVRHGGHPVLAMCAGNAVVTSDPAGNRKLDKSKATGRIDGMVALTMAMGVAPDDTSEPQESIYETRDVLFI